MATSSGETRYRRMLEDIATDLSSDEVSELVFLMRLHAKGKKVRSEKHLDPKKLLTVLEELGCIGVNNLTLLAELFELINRGDLRDRIVKQLGHIEVFKHEINDFMRLLWKFGQELNSNDLENAIRYLEWTKQTENIEKVWQIFEKAFEKELLKENNTESITRFADRTKLRMKLQLVLNRELPIYSPGITSTSGTSQVPHGRVSREEAVLPSQPTQTSVQNPLSQDSKPYIQTGRLHHVKNDQNVDINEIPDDFREKHNKDVMSQSKHNSVQRISTLREYSHVGSGREQHSSFGSSLLSSSVERTISSNEAAANGNQEVEDGKSHGKSLKDQVSQASQHGSVFQNNRKFRRTQHQIVPITINPRGNQIIKLSDEEMRQYFCEEKIGQGAYGIVYKAKTLEEVELECVIKVIKFTDEIFQKSYDREVDSGRILHPFMNPIIARTECLSDAGGVSYLMFPYMKNGELHHNIDRENKGELLSPATQESNSIIWTRCIYQIVQGMDYLHTAVPSVRGCIFHRDLTSRNIFLDENFNVRIGDFGIAVEAKLNATHATLTKTAGTEGYHPPNMNLKEYNASYDVFSVGVVMLEILTGKEAKQGNVYLYEEYSKDKCPKDEGYLYLKQDLQKRANKIKVAEWSSLCHRDELAKIALDAITLDETLRTKINLLQRLEDLRLVGKERYRKPAKHDRCVSCCINIPANLSLKGKACAGSKSPCRPFCIPCLNNHINPLVCPEHGKTRPPLGDHVYGVFVAGNNVKKMENCSYSAEEVADVFIRDVYKIVDVLTAKYPFILGAIKENLRVVTPKKPGTAENDMEQRVKSVFDDISSSVKKVLTDNKMDPEKDRLPNSLFIFYFSGHCHETEGLVLGGETEKITTTKGWIKEMLHNILGVDQVLVILDCCHADSQNFADAEGLNAGNMSACRRTKASIFHLSSCENYEKSLAKGQGSYFTSILWQGLKGFSRKVSGDGTVQPCDECCGPVQYCNHCEEEIKQKINNSGSRDDAVKCVDCKARKQISPNVKVPCMEFHDQWIKKQFVTVASLKEFIQAHFSLLDLSYSPVANTLNNGDKIVLAYYNPDKPCISIYLKSSNNSDNSSQKPYHFSMDCLKQDIGLIKKDLIKYTEEKKMDCDVLTFHQSHGQKVADSSHLVAIYPKYGKDKNKELTTLDCIYKAWMTSRDLEARVRENIEELSVNCPVIHRTITKCMVERSKDYKTDYLRISKDFIRIPIRNIQEAKKYILEMSTESPQPNMNFRDLWDHLSAALRKLPNLKEDEAGERLEFRLYDEFSIVDIK